jgi:mannosyltransferase OCH1-like enzyme
LIPKIIHYCWFGKGDMPKLETECIRSWKKHLPDYEFVLWNEERFDVTKHPYVKEAYEAKKYAFVTDYVRLYALYYYGGIYMDTDVEVLKPLDSFLVHKAFIGCESDVLLGTGTIGAESGHPWIKDLLAEYENKRFILPDGSYNTIPNTYLVAEFTKKAYGWEPKDAYQVLKEDLHVYPFDFFCAKDLRTGKICANENTYTIHRFSGSWKSKREKLNDEIKRIIGTKGTEFVVKVKNKMKGSRM